MKELIISKEPDLLDSFMDVSCRGEVEWVGLTLIMAAVVQEVIAFQQDNSPEVRKFVVSFMEEAR